MTRLAWIFAAALALAPTGCKQDEGERCQTDSDCATGLKCCVPTVLEGTCCREEEEEDAGAPPAEPAPDFPVDAPVPDVDAADAAVDSATD